MKMVFHGEVERFIRTLQKPTIARLLRTLDLLEKYGRNLGMPHVKFVVHGMYELRVRGKQEIRIFFVFYHGNIVCIHGFVKKSQKSPRVEFETAKKRLGDLT